VRRRLLPLAAVAALAGAAVLVVTLLPGGPPAADEQARRIAAQLRCPDCQALSVDDSHTAAADAIRAEIASQLAAGRSADEIRQHFVDRYGPWIVLTPASAWPWLLPFAVLAAGLAALGWWLMRPRAVATPPSRPPSEADRRRLADELEQLDG
jgi:cytochrome c-type biogenesis protein CcmH